MNKLKKYFLNLSTANIDNKVRSFRMNLLFAFLNSIVISSIFLVFIALFSIFTLNLSPLIPLFGLILIGGLYGIKDFYKYISIEYGISKSGNEIYLYEKSGLFLQNIKYISIKKISTINDTTISFLPIDIGSIHIEAFDGETMNWNYINNCKEISREILSYQL